MILHGTSFQTWYFSWHPNNCHGLGSALRCRFPRVMTSCCLEAISIAFHLDVNAFCSGFFQARRHSRRGVIGGAHLAPGSVLGGTLHPPGPSPLGVRMPTASAFCPIISFPSSFSLSNLFCSLFQLILKRRSKGLSLTRRIMFKINIVEFKINQAV